MSVTWDLLPWTCVVVLVAGIVIGGFAVWLWTRPEEPDPIPTGRFPGAHYLLDEAMRVPTVDWSEDTIDVASFAGGAGTGNGRKASSRGPSSTPRPYDWQTDG